MKSKKITKYTKINIKEKNRIKKQNEIQNKLKKYKQMIDRREFNANYVMNRRNEFIKRNFG